MNHVDIEKFHRYAVEDRELKYKFRGYSGVIRLVIEAQSIDLTIESGEIVGAAESTDVEAAAVFSAPAAFWESLFTPGVPAPGYEGLTVAATRGLSLEGDFFGTIAPYQAALQRVYQVLRASVVGVVERRPASNPFRSTDNAVGRYIYVTANGVESRIYYEKAGTGPIPMLLQATAGTDGREYRHLLANPALQERYTMYAYDLPFHGKSLPPEGVRWWEEAYLPDQEYLINWVVAIADALDLEQPHFMGCSVGGQLALDLAAERPDRFGAFISLNGWYDLPPMPGGFNNDSFRTPSISSEYFPSMMLGATGPQAPEEHAHEVYWIYRSNFPGIYAGDNDYFMSGHDLKVNGHKIDAVAKPLYVITGEYDASTHVPDHGGAAIAANIPGAVHLVAEGLSHFGPSDDPVAFSEFIVPVLDEIIAKVATAEPATH
ncbi:alpha/beta hydrolase [Streptomyces sp. NPDC002766]|uniref:alpha/beta fold hydrolase n=1 Tax=unclassified Streptomyces TaxID=2593676 RepID=UPI0033198240